MTLASGADRRYLWNVVALGLFLRGLLLFIFWATDAIFTLRLSPDSERYHRVGLVIMQEMNLGNFNWPAWIDDGWFQFTGFVYFLFGAHPFIMQLINVMVSCATVVVVFYLALEVSRSGPVARISAFLVAVFPSFIYWSCLMLKDPTAIFSLSLLVLSTLKIRSQYSSLWMAAMLLGLLLLLGIRDYMFFVCIGLIGVSMIFFTPYSVPRSGSWIGLAALCFVPMAMGYGVFGYSFISSSIYFDLDYINHIRVAMGDHGSGAIFEHSAVATWGSGGLFADVLAFFKGVLFFFVTLNPTNIGSVRQLMALPEVLLLLLLLPHLARGLYWLWLDRQNSFPVLVFAFGVMVMLVSATTNIGALFRWRMQVMPLFIIAIAIGLFWARRGVFYRLACQLTGFRQ
jgi:hypothetical protein